MSTFQQERNPDDRTAVSHAISFGRAFAEEPGAPGGEGEPCTGTGGDSPFERRVDMPPVRCQQRSSHDGESWPGVLAVRRSDDLEFLSAGDALLTRRVKAKSARRAVVVRFSKRRRATNDKVCWSSRKPLRKRNASSLCRRRDVAGPCDLPANERASHPTGTSAAVFCTSSRAQKSVVDSTDFD